MAPLAVMTCWSCRGPFNKGALFCPTCGAVQPPVECDHFSRLEMVVSFEIDNADLERRYFDRQRQLHPDRFAARTAKERAISQRQAVAINEAFETLKDPLRRADYLVHLRGVGVLPEGCSLVNDQALLTEALELREALAEAKTVADVAALERRAFADGEGCLEELSTAFASDDLAAASRLITRLKYLRKLADECRMRKARLRNAER